MRKGKKLDTVVRAGGHTCTTLHGFILIINSIYKLDIESRAGSYCTRPGGAI